MKLFWGWGWRGGENFSKSETISGDRSYNLRKEVVSLAGGQIPKLHSHK